MSWRIANSLLQLRKQINNAAPTRSKISDGTLGDAAHSIRSSDHNPWVKDDNTGIVTALDITNDPDNGCDAVKIVESLVLSRDTRIKYIIWNRRIINSQVSSWRWRKYSGINPHTKHFHISVKSDKMYYDNSDEWRIDQQDAIDDIEGSKILKKGIEASNKYRVNSRKKLRLREGPGTGFQILNNLNPGQIVTVLTNKGDWSQVDIEDDGLIDGYCFSDYLVPIHQRD